MALSRVFVRRKAEIHYGIISIEVKGVSGKDE